MSPLRAATVAALAAFVAGPAAAQPAWTRFSAEDPKAAPAAERGRAVYENLCAICHGAERDAAGTISLRFKYGDTKPAVLTERRDLTPELVKFYVRNGVATMPFFRKTELDDQDLEALADYLGRRRR